MQGFLPEVKFSRILTEPVNLGSRRRGRRPRSEMPKPLQSVSDSNSSGLGPPLFMNGGLMGSMDTMVAMQNLRGGIPGIPISGIMASGFPHSYSPAVQAGGAGVSADNAKNGLNMLPMMLQGIPHPHGAAISQQTLFSIGAMMAHTPPPSSVHTSTSSSSLSATKVTTTAIPATSEAASSLSITAAERENTISSGTDEGEKGSSQKEREATENTKRPQCAEVATIITSTSRAHLASTNLGGGTGSHLTFNPFLIPGMSHGLLYPHMFLPHGGIMALPALSPSAVDGPHGSPKRRRKRGWEVRERDEEKVKATTGKVAERKSTVKAIATSHSASFSSPSTPPTCALDPGLSLTQEPLIGQGDVEHGPAEMQETNSTHHPEEAATEDTEKKLEDTGGEAEEEDNHDNREQRQVQGEKA